MILPRGGGIYTHPFKYQEEFSPPPPLLRDSPVPFYARSAEAATSVQIDPGYPGRHVAEQLVLDGSGPVGSVLHGGGVTVEHRLVPGDPYPEMNLVLI